MDGTILVWDLGYGPLPTPGVFPTATPLAEPQIGLTITPRPLPADMSQYDITTHTDQFLDGGWQVLLVSGVAKDGTVQPETYHRVRVTGPQGQDYSYEEWASGIGRVWSGFHWWPDAPDAIYWFETLNVGYECQPQYNTGLRRMDLNTGEVHSVAGLDDSWLGSLFFSPDRAEAAYVNAQDFSVGEIIIRSLVSSAWLTPPSAIGAGRCRGWSSSQRETAS